MKNKSQLVTIAILLIAMSSIAQVTGTFTDTRDGKTYKTVKIGTQTWMAENLAYRSNSGCWAYDNNQTNVATYGYLYIYESALSSCPSGWHLPSNTEWDLLMNYLGGEEIAGGKLKSKKGWDSPNEGATNSSGFTALSGGGRRSNGTYYYLGNMGLFWSITKDNEGEVWYYGLGAKYSAMAKDNYSKGFAFSVRCVKD